MASHAARADLVRRLNSIRGLDGRPVYDVGKAIWALRQFAKESGEETIGKAALCKLLEEAER